jgi:hypothetical protein
MPELIYAWPLFPFRLIQFHPKDNYMVVVEAKMVDLVIATMKAQARAQDHVTPKRPSN